MDALLRQIDELKAELDSLRPLRSDSICSLMTALDVEIVYSSNAIEGNSLTLRETQLVLEQGITVGGKPLKDQIEAVNLSHAWDAVKEMATRSTAIQESELLDLHLMVLGRDDPHAGHYRNVPVFTRGATHVPPNAAKVSALMADMFATDHPPPSSCRLRCSPASRHCSCASVYRRQWPRSTSCHESLPHAPWIPASAHSAHRAARLL